MKKNSKLTHSYIIQILYHHAQCMMKLGRYLRQVLTLYSRLMGVTCHSLFESPIRLYSAFISKNSHERSDLSTLGWKEKQYNSSYFSARQTKYMTSIIWHLGIQWHTEDLYWTGNSICILLHTYIMENASWNSTNNLLKNKLVHKKLLTVV